MWYLGLYKIKVEYKSINNYSNIATSGFGLSGKALVVLNGKISKQKIKQKGEMLAVNTMEQRSLLQMVQLYK